MTCVMLGRIFFLNGSKANRVSAEVFNLKQKKTNFLIFYIKISKQNVAVCKNIEF